MTPRQKLEQLTRSWYGYSVFAALVSVLSLQASGVLSLAIGLGVLIAVNAVGLAVSIAFQTWLGRKLVARSSGTRLFLVVFSGLFAVLGALSTLTRPPGRSSTSGRSRPSARVALTAAATMLNARSFRVLGETSVRAYFV